MRSPVVFGTAYGGVMPLYAVLAREYFGQRDHGHGVRRGDDGLQHRHGARALAGGWIFDTFSSYRWLYIGSSTVGLGAVAVAAMFSARPQPRLQMA